MNSNASIHLVNCDVEGVDTLKRADSIRNAFLGRGSLQSSAIPILNGINFACKAGDRIAFIGNNGSGKSSLLKVIANIYPLKSGVKNVNGSITAIIEMGLGIEPELTGRQNIKILMLYNNMLDKYNQEIEDRIIEFSELGDKIDWQVKNYSSGMLSRLTFASSIYQTPDILLLDEVFATGDQHFVEKCLHFMEQKINSVPITILVSHQLDIIQKYCNRVVLLKNGSIIKDGNPDEVCKIYLSGKY